MSTTRAARLSTVWLGLVMLGVPLSSQASIMWTFHQDYESLCIAPSNCGSTYEESLKFKSHDPVGGPTVDVTAWGDSGDNKTIEQGYVGGPWSGLGVKNNASSSVDPGEGDNPEHAMDNNGNGRQVFDSLRFDFEEAISLTKVMMGWYQYDSDISVLRHTGTGDDSLGGKLYSELHLIENGWEIVGNYRNLHFTSYSRDISGDTAGKFSSSWLVATFNPVFGDVNWSSGNDYIKLKQLYGHTNGVPEPSSFLLLVFALPLLRLFRNNAGPASLAA